MYSWEDIKSRFWNFLRWQPTHKTKRSWLWVTIKEFKIPALKDAVRDDSHVLMRVLWLVIFLLLLGVGGWFAVAACWRVFNDPIELTVKNNGTSNQAFPAITHGMQYNLKKTSIENLKMISRKLAFGIGEMDYDGVVWYPSDAEKMAISVNQFCVPQNPLSHWHQGFNPSGGIRMGETSLRFIDGNDESLKSKTAPLLLKASPKCHEMFHGCAWNAKKAECKGFFRETVTNVGMSCTWNRMPESVLNKYHNETLKDWIAPENVTNEELDAWRKWKPDNEAFFSFYDLVLGINRTVPETQKFGGKKGGLHYVVRLHDDEKNCLQNEIGHVFQVHDPREEADLINSGIHVPPNHYVFVSIRPTIIKADNDIREMSKERRGCVFADEVNLDYYNKFTTRNCHLECLADYIYEMCQCNSLTDPKNATRVLCAVTDRTCVIDAQNKFYAGEGKKRCHKCLPSCSETIYHTTVTMIPYSRDNPPQIVKQIKDLGENESTIIFSISYEEFHYYHISRGYKYTWFGIVADIGGNLGLTNGVSFIDIVRVLVALLVFAVPWKKVDKWLKVFWTFIRRKLFRVPQPPVYSIIDELNRMLEIAFPVPHVKRGGDSQRPSIADSQGHERDSMGTGYEKIVKLVHTHDAMILLKKSPQS